LNSLSPQEPGLRQTHAEGQHQGRRVLFYGLGRFPVTLYKEQWLKLLDQTDDIPKFIDAHSAELKTKG
jgi:hypothetical protein